MCRSKSTDSLRLKSADTLSLGGPGPSLFTRRRGGCGAAVEQEANERVD
jgi:hypothetical protein